MVFRPVDKSRYRWLFLSLVAVTAITRQGLVRVHTPQAVVDVRVYEQVGGRVYTYPCTSERQTCKEADDDEK